MYLDIRLLKDIVDNTPLPIAVYTGASLKIEFANPAMIEAWGKGNEVIGKNYLEVVPEIENQKIFDQAMTVFKTGIPFHAKDKRVDLEIGGILTTHYFNYSFIPLFNDQGTVYGVMNTGSDVTDLHLAKQQVENSDQRLRLAIESSGIGTYEMDLATKKIIACGNFKSIWSIEGEIPEDQLAAKLHPQDQQLRESSHREALATGKIDYEARIVQDDHSIRWVRISGKLIRDENGKPETII